MPPGPSIAPTHDVPIFLVLEADDQGLCTVPSPQKVADGDCGRGLVLRGESLREAHTSALGSLEVSVPPGWEEKGKCWLWIYLPKEMSGRAKLSPPGLLLTFLS